MLILTRRSGEAIEIGADVEITVLEVCGDHVRLGISAPRSVPVVRKELREAVVIENREAAASVVRVGRPGPLRIASAPSRDLQNPANDH